MSAFFTTRECRGIVPGTASTTKFVSRVRFPDRRTTATPRARADSAVSPGLTSGSSDSAGKDLWVPGVHCRKLSTREASLLPVYSYLYRWCYMTRVLRSEPVLILEYGLGSHRRNLYPRTQ
eukprot:1827371-Rhodomonas_salina.4